MATGYLKAGLELSRRIIARGKSNETLPFREELRRTIIFSRGRDERGSPGAIYSACRIYSYVATFVIRSPKRAERGNILRSIRARARARVCVQINYTSEAYNSNITDWNIWFKLKLTEPQYQLCCCIIASVKGFIAEYIVLSRITEIHWIKYVANFI